MVNKFLHAEQWEEGDYASLETELREACLAQGVHSVWHEMAKRSDLFGQFSACPVVESKSTPKKKTLDLSEIAIDPLDATSCLDVFKSIPDEQYSAEDLNEAFNQATFSEWPSVESALLDLKGIFHWYL